MFPRFQLKFPNFETPLEITQNRQKKVYCDVRSWGEQRNWQQRLRPLWSKLHSIWDGTVKPVGKRDKNRQTGFPSIPAPTPSWTATTSACACWIATCTEIMIKFTIFWWIQRCAESEFYILQPWKSSWLPEHFETSVKTEISSMTDIHNARNRGRWEKCSCIDMIHFLWNIPRYTFLKKGLVSYGNAVYKVIVLFCAVPPPKNFTSQRWATGTKKEKHSQSPQVFLIVLRTNNASTVPLPLHSAKKTVREPRNTRGEARLFDAVTRKRCFVNKTLEALVHAETRHSPFHRHRSREKTNIF